MHSRVRDDDFAVVDFIADVDYVDVESAVGVSAVGVSMHGALCLAFDGVQALVDVVRTLVGLECCPDIIIGVTRRVTP